MKDIFEAIIAGDTQAVARFIDSDAKVLATKNSAGYQPVMLAAMHGNVDIIKLLLSRGAKAKIKTGTKSPAHLAALNKHTDAARLLVEHGAAIDIPDKKGWTFFHEMIYLGNARAALLLLELGANALRVGKHFGKQHAPLHLAMKSSSMEMMKLRQRLVQKMLDAGADPNLLNSEGESPLHIAAMEGYSKLVELLLDRGGNIEVADPDGATPLFYAVLGANFATVRTLLDRGANINARLTSSSDKFSGESSLGMAIQFGHRYIARLLRDRGASRPPYREPEKPSHKELHSACWQGQLEDAQMILDDDPASVHTTSEMGFTQATPLHWAATAGHADIAQLLVDRGAKVNESSLSQTYTPLRDAAVQGHAAVVRVLVKAGANLNNDAGNRPALHEAMTWGHVAVVRELLKGGADPNVPDREQKTPLYKILHDDMRFSTPENSAACAELLRAHGGHE